jgi:hypothetical protein
MGKKVVFRTVFLSPSWKKGRPSHTLWKQNTGEEEITRKAVSGL